MKGTIIKGYPESSIRAFKLDDGETVGRPKLTNLYESPPTVNPDMKPQ